MRLSKKLRDLGVVHKEFNIPLSNMYLNIYVHPNPKVVVINHPELEDDFEFECIYYEFYDSNEAIAIFKPSATVGEIAHEMMHFVNEFFERIHYNPLRKNDEIQARYMEWATNCAYEVIRKANKLKK